MPLPEQSGRHAVEEKEEGEKIEKLASLFGTIYEFLSDFKNFDATNFLCNTFPADTACTGAVDTSFFVPSSSSYVVDGDVVGTSLHATRETGGRRKRDSDGKREGERGGGEVGEFLWCDI